VWKHVSCLKGISAVAKSLASWLNFPIQECNLILTFISCIFYLLYIFSMWSLHLIWSTSFHWFKEKISDILIFIVFITFYVALFFFMYFFVFYFSFIFLFFSICLFVFSTKRKIYYFDVIIIIIYILFINVFVCSFYICFYLLIFLRPNTKLYKHICIMS